MSNGKSGMNETGPVANHSPAWSTAFSEVWTTAVMAVQGRTTDSSGDLSRLDVNLEAIKVGSLGVTSADRFATRQFVRIAGARKIGSTRPRCAAAAVMRLVECNPSSRHTSLASWSECASRTTLAGDWRFIWESRAASHRRAQLPSSCGRGTRQ